MSISDIFFVRVIKAPIANSLNAFFCLRSASCRLETFQMQNIRKFCSIKNFCNSQIVKDQNVKHSMNIHGQCLATSRRSISLYNTFHSVSRWLWLLGVIFAKSKRKISWKGLFSFHSYLFEVRISWLGEVGCCMFRYTQWKLFALINFSTVKNKWRKMNKKKCYVSILIVLTI